MSWRYTDEKTQGLLAQLGEKHFDGELPEPSLRRWFSCSADFVENDTASFIVYEGHIAVFPNKDYTSPTCFSCGSAYSIEENEYAYPHRDCFGNTERVEKTIIYSPTCPECDVES